MFFLHGEVPVLYTTDGEKQENVLIDDLPKLVINEFHYYISFRK